MNDATRPAIRPASRLAFASILVVGVATAVYAASVVRRSAADAAAFGEGRTILYPGGFHHDEELGPAPKPSTSVMLRYARAGRC